MRIHIFLLAIIISSYSAVADQPNGEHSFKSIDRPTSGLLLEGLEFAETSELESDLQVAVTKRSVSEIGLSLLKKFEGEVRCDEAAQLHCPYNDVSNYCTIGHGHLIAKQSCDDIIPELESLEFLGGISDDEATALLEKDIERAQAIVEAHIDEAGRLGEISIDDNQYDALVSFIYNVGGGNFNRSTLLKRLKSREAVSGTADIEFQFSRWVRSGGVVYEGLKNRRLDEAKHFFLDYGLPSELDEEETALGVSEEAYIDIQNGE